MKAETLVVGVAAVAVIGVIGYVVVKRTTLATVPPAPATAPVAATQPAAPKDPWEQLAFGTALTFVDQLFDRVF